MSDYLIIVLIGLLAFEGAGWWVIPVGALGLSIGAWLQLWEILRSHPAVQLGRQIYAALAVSFGNGLIACGASYVMGIVGRLLAG